METFVREAIARAAFERSQAEEGAGMGDGFLEVGSSARLRVSFTETDRVLMRN